MKFLRKALLGLLLVGQALPLAQAQQVFLASFPGKFTYATPNFVQATSTSILTLAYTSAQTAGDLNVIAVGWNTAAVLSSVSDSKGNTYTRACTVANISTFNEAIYYASNIASGSNTVTIAFVGGGTPTGYDLRIAEYGGIAKSASLDTCINGTGTGTALNSGSSSTSQPDLIVGGAYVDNAVSAPGAGFTERVLSFGSNIIEDQNQATAGSYNATATQNVSGNWIMQMAAFKAAPSGGGGGGGSMQVSVGSGGTANRFVDKTGTAIDFVGANIYGLETITIQGSQTPTFSGYAGNTVPNFAKMATQGINIVRIPLNQNAVLGTSTSDGSNWSGTIQTAYLNFLDSVITAANAAGIYVDLDLHWAAPSNFTASAQTYFPDSVNGPAVWTLLANRYKSNRAVLFELYNEPFSVSDAQLNSGGSATTYVNSSGTHSFSYSFTSYPAMLAAVRATGAQNIVIFGSNNFSSTPTWIQTYNPTDGAGELAVNLAHFYQNAFYNLGTGSSSNNYSTFNPLIQYIIARYPGISTEYAEGSGSDSGGLTSFSTGANTGSQSGCLTYEKQYHIGSIAWSYNPPNPPTQSSQNLVSDASGTLTTWGTQYLAFF